MNWGKKILIVYLTFVAGIVFMVIKSSLQNTDLVTTDYYDKELKYQEKIDEVKRSEALSAPVAYTIGNNGLTISFPKDFTGRQLVGEVLLYCPADEKKDLRKDFTVLDEPVQVAIPAGRKGLYELHISWKAGGVSYYVEQKICI